MSTMKKKKAFTLVELLVVISIIALLMSILMPSLQRAKTMAKRIVCQSNLKQWGLVWAMYVEDNEGKFHSGDIMDMDNLWMSALWPYLSSNFDFGLCPMAKRPKSGITDGVAFAGDTFKAWGIYTGNWGWSNDDIYCSYGLNAYTRNPPSDVRVQYGKYPTKYNYRTPYVKGAANIPLFLDSTWIDDWMKNNDPRLIPQEAPGGGFCIDRHEGEVDSLFCDWSVRRVGLKGLWKLKWNRDFFRYPDLTENDWPDWMKNFKETY